MYKIFYECNGKQCGKNALYCKAHGHKNWLCAYTTNSKNAKNGPCNDPWNHPERFKEEKEGKVTYFTEFINNDGSNIHG